MRRNRRISQTNLDTPAPGERAGGPPDTAVRRATDNVFRVLRLFAVFAAAGFLAGFLLTYPGFSVENAEVKGVRYSKSAAARKAADRYEGKNIFRAMFVKSSECRDVLAQPEVRSVKAVIRFPDTVTVRVTERVPFVLIKHGKNEYLADRSGYVFHKLAGGERTRPLPVLISGVELSAGCSISGLTPDAYIRTQDAKKARALAALSSEGGSGKFADEKAVEQYFADKINLRRRQIYDLQFLYNVAVYADQKKLQLGKLWVDGDSSLVLQLAGEGPAVEFGALANTIEKLDLLATVSRLRPDILRSAREICLLDEETATYKPKKNVKVFPKE
ncbi:MAG: FtsQ-type POTRA domain-containing protein [Abditibacteriota bacterium]|nr:FtsQ-type POTRA domain-containing protein [Abditibacteriota bacterium]